MNNKLYIDSNEPSLRVHLIVALCCLPIYIYGGEVFKIIICPYVLYMLFRMRPLFIPALLIHFMNGSTISFVILLGCLVISFMYYKKLRKIKLNYLFIGSLLPIPFLLFVFYLKIVVLHEAYGVWINYLFMYLGFFSFFYFALLSNQFKFFYLKYILIVLAIAVIYQFFVVETVRYLVFSFTIFGVILSYSLRKNSQIRRYGSLIFLSIGLIILIIIVTKGLSTTMLFTTLIAIVLALVYLRNKIMPVKYTYILLFSTIGIVAISIYNFNTTNSESSGYNLEESEIKLTDLNSIIDRAKYKLFEDRAPLWSAVFKGSVLEGALMPPILLQTYSFKTIDGADFDTDLAAHNLFLELIRFYGVLVGLYLSVIFCVMIIKSARLLTLPNNNIYYVVFVSSIISTSFYGGMAGQYILMSNFSFLFMGLVGLSYGYYYLRIKSNEYKKN